MKNHRWIELFAIVATVAGAATATPRAYSQDHPKSGHAHASEKTDEAKIKVAFAKLSEEDRATAAAQRYCPMMDNVRLGSMGAPVKVVIEGKAVFLCCNGCKDEALEHGKETLAQVSKIKRSVAAIAKLPASDQSLAESQLNCPISKDSRLGSMGAPVKLMLDGKPVFLCCKTCEREANKNPKATLAKVDALKKENAAAIHHDEDGHDHKPRAGHAHTKDALPKK